MKIVDIGEVIFNLDQFSHAERCVGMMSSSTRIWFKTAAPDGKPYVDVQKKLWDVKDILKKAHEVDWIC